MVRVINYFDTQVRVPATREDGEKPNGKPAFKSRTAFEQHIHDDAVGSMTDEEKARWYSQVSPSLSLLSYTLADSSCQVLESVRLRYRKLQRFAR